MSNLYGTYFPITRADIAEFRQPIGGLQLRKLVRTPNSTVDDATFAKMQAAFESVQRDVALAQQTVALEQCFPPPHALVMRELMQQRELKGSMK